MLAGDGGVLAVLSLGLQECDGDELGEFCLHFEWKVLVDLCN